MFNIFFSLSLLQPVAEKKTEEVPAAATEEAPAKEEAAAAEAPKEAGEAAPAAEAGEAAPAAAEETPAESS